MTIGIIGGTGLEKLNVFSEPGEVNVDTPFGPPSSTLFHGVLEGQHVYILSRHGRDHTIPPTQVNNRANIMALKQFGCDCIIATTACGSLREEIGRGDVVIPDQFIDFTRHRAVTFFEHFEPHGMKHTPMADPFSDKLRKVLINQAGKLNIPFHPKGTVITIEGPRFSTRAESHMFRLWGADIINMSIAPEAILANEAGIPYAAVALSTDYDCWKTEEEPVVWEEVLRIFDENVHKVTELLIHCICEL
ncbi:MAG: S-methyl-5'-thioadenosine phosphorylase [Bacteroidetes bacterium]|nr:S-methyl-5'-thioadenosine phosphorylase [Bacteroidota bacterium]